MVQPSEESIVNAWRALAGNENGEGWRTIPVANAKSLRLFAGRHFPGNEEAVLVGFSSVRIPLKDHLPEGNGFSVSVADFGPQAKGKVWLALVRQPAGSLEMFSMMATDVVSTIITSTSTDDDLLLGLFLGRIKAWQSFMERNREGVLSWEAEVGLHGELEVLASILEAGLPARTATESWVGPIGGIQDFRMGTGAIEVKATISKGGFPAIVSSLEQLDDNLVKPLFIAGVRFHLTDEGLNLPGRIAVIRDLLGQDPAALAVFETRLLHAGFFSSMSERYVRRLGHYRTSIFPVETSFPRLTHANVPAAIHMVRYELDLDLVNVPEVGMNHVLSLTGGL